MLTSRDPVLGLILAGGLGTRLGGGDKALRLVAGRPLLAHVVERIAPQCSALVLNANGEPARFAAFGLPVVADQPPNQAGPLAGVLAGLEWMAREKPECRWLVSVASDNPFLPSDLVIRLQEAREREAATVAVAASFGRQHHTIALWPAALSQTLSQAVRVEGLRQVGAFLARHPGAIAHWEGDPDPFFNINTPADLIEAEGHLDRHR